MVVGINWPQVVEEYFQNMVETMTRNGEIEIIRGNEPS